MRSVISLDSDLVDHPMLHPGIPFAYSVQTSAHQIDDTVPIRLRLSGESRETQPKPYHGVPRAY